ncbi:MAG: serine hydrolase [Flavobacteriales bacterium]|nr:serine hydrolase [Flavobacteriales bacterium]
MRKTLLLVLMASATTASTAQTFNAQLAAVLQFKLDSMVALFSNTQGVSAGVYCPGQGVWEGASGISHSGTPLSTDMMLGLASNSKLFVAVTLLKLAENNVIDLDHAISNYIPTYQNVDPNITVRQLLNHTSGVNDPFFTTSLLDSILAHPTHSYDINEVMNYLGAPQFAPGTGYGYSNINYILAGEVARSATGLHISELIRNIILTPLQMDSTFYDLEETVSGTVAHRWYQGVDFADTSRISLNTSGGPAGAMFSTAGEVVQWYHALMSGQIINATSLAEMTTFASPGNYGLGIGLFSFFGNTCWGHGGSTIGYKSRTIYDPCMKTAVVGLSNSDPSAVDGITAILYKALVDRLPRCPQTITGSTVVCQGQQGLTYTVPLIANATGYVWTLPNGATIGSGSGSNSIAVNFGPTATTGTISVIGVNGFGESDVTSFNVTVNQIPPSPTVSTNGNVLQSSATDGNQWYDQNGPIDGATGMTYTVTVSGTYLVVVTLAGCSSGASLPTDMTITGVDGRGALASTLIYPNPFDREIIVETTEMKQLSTVEILNATGHTLRSQSFIGRAVIATHDLAPGVYLIRTDNGVQHEFHRAVKLH